MTQSMDSTKIAESLSLVQGHENEEQADNDEFYHTQHGSHKNQKVLGFAFISFFSFTCIEMIFALSAHSTSLMADAAAMFVDAGTYLCNLVAEKLKDRPPTEEELQLPEATREYKRKLRCLNLELFPPLVSMSLLLYITYTATMESIHTLQGLKSDEDEDEANANVMMFFGILFLVIDFVNMFCFSTVNGAIIPLTILHLDAKTNTSNTAIRSNDGKFNGSEHTASSDSMDDDESLEDGVQRNQYDLLNSNKNRPSINLNMCSAWTVGLI